LIDMYYSAKLLEPGGVVLFDDSQHPHIKKLLRFVRRNLSHCFEEMDLRRFHPDKRIRFQIARVTGYTQMTAFTKTGDLEENVPVPVELEN